MAFDLHKALNRGVVLFDGAMGTMLYENGVFINKCFDAVNLSNPSLVEKIHRSYIDAGADVIETNTFSANYYKLKAHSLEDEVYQINRKGAEIAASASRGRVGVAGSIGPLGIKIEPWGPTSNQEAREAFATQAEAMIDGGVDIIILETFADLNQIHQAIKAVKSISDIPVIAQMTLQVDGLGLYGTEPGDFAIRLEEWGADVVGVNCSVGPRVMLEAVEKMATAVDTFISAMPNAGVPQNVEGRNIYLVSPEYITEYARRFIKVGARVVGGCCGTTPSHIKAIQRGIQSFRPSVTKHPPRPGDKKVEKRKKTSIARREKSSLARKIDSGEFVTVVELVPPKGCNPAGTLESARQLSAARIDAINIPDSPRATSRMSPLALAVLIQNRVGVETILHYCCRDRNILGMQADLLGAHAMELRNILLITGDPIKIGDYPDATDVFDIDSIGLTNVVRKLNQGYDIGERKLKTPTSFHIGVGVNPGAINFQEEMRRFYWKVDAGAEFAITQPVFDMRVFERFVREIESIRIPIIAGLWPLVSYKNAEFMHNELPGVSVPADIMKRMKEAGGKEETAEEGVKIAVELLRKIRPMVDGVQISAPFNRHHLAISVISGFLGKQETLAGDDFD